MNICILPPTPKFLLYIWITSIGNCKERVWVIFYINRLYWPVGGTAARSYKLFKNSVEQLLVKLQIKKFSQAAWVFKFVQKHENKQISKVLVGIMSKLLVLVRANPWLFLKFSRFHINLSLKCRDLYSPPRPPQTRKYPSPSPAKLRPQSQPKFLVCFRGV